MPVENKLFVVCTKCGAKWLIEALERKQVFACQLCKEPGLRYLDEKGEPGEAWPKEGK